MQTCVRREIGMYIGGDRAEIRAAIPQKFKENRPRDAFGWHKRLEKLKPQRGRTCIERSAPRAKGLIQPLRIFHIQLRARVSAETSPALPMETGGRGSTAHGAPQFFEGVSAWRRRAKASPYVWQEENSGRYSPGGLARGSTVSFAGAPRDASFSPAE